MMKTASGFIMGCALGAWCALPSDTPFPRMAAAKPPLSLAANSLSIRETIEKPALSTVKNKTDKENNQLQFKKSNDGHFHTNVAINGQNINFMIDTGASIMAISKKTAKKHNLLPKDTKFSQIGRTAGGKVRFAEIRLKEVRVGEYILRNVPAAVTDSENSPSLLGMSFLKVVPRIVIENNVMRFEEKSSNLTKNKGSVRTAETE